MVRCPDGVGGECFYQRHLRGKKEYIVLESLEEVVRMVQNGAVELHTWGATRPDLKHPDRITLDLDPGPDLPWDELVRATRITRQLVDSLGFGSFLKTTGGKGLHVVFPIERRNTWDEVKDWSIEERQRLRDAVPKLGLAAETPRGENLLELGRRILDLAEAGLNARAKLNSSGDNESGFLDPLREVIASGKTPAERLLDRYHGEWAGDIGRIYEEESF